MKDLLYLKDEQIKEFIQLLYYAYRETFSDPREILTKKYFGPAHLRALNLMTESELEFFNALNILFFWVLYTISKKALPSLSKNIFFFLCHFHLELV